MPSAARGGRCSSGAAPASISLSRKRPSLVFGRFCGARRIAERVKCDAKSGAQSMRRAANCCCSLWARAPGVRYLYRFPLLSLNPIRRRERGARSGACGSGHCRSIYFSPSIKETPPVFFLPCRVRLHANGDRAAGAEWRIRRQQSVMSVAALCAEPFVPGGAAFERRRFAGSDARPADRALI